MSIHIGAKHGQIAPTVLLPGDPLRAKYIAESVLEDAILFNEVRGMLGFTGWWKIWAEYGALVVEMESSALYTLAAKFKADALSILTVSDSLVTGEKASAQQREQGFTKMAEIALEIAP